MPYLNAMARILASADVGSNTAHLLIARTDGKTITRLDNRNDWIALGEIVARMGTIPAAHVSRIVSTLRRFKEIATKALAEEMVVFATEAMRTADNSKQVLETIREKTGIKVKLISHQEEAYLGLRGAFLDAPQAERTMLFEVGGGSAQIALCINGKITHEASLPIGTGRLIVEANLTNPCADEDLQTAKKLIAKAIDGCPMSGEADVAVASGGVGRGIWRALHPDGDKLLHRKEIEYLFWSVSRLTVPVIEARYCVKQRRAETLVPGALVFLALMEKFGKETVVVSEYGVREGAILELAQGKIKGQVL